MKVTLWTVLAVILTIFTLSAVLNGIQSLSTAQSVGAQSSFGAESGAIDGVLQIAFILLLALAALGSWRRAAKARRARLARMSGEPRRPWER